MGCIPSKRPPPRQEAPAKPRGARRAAPAGGASQRGREPLGASQKSKSGRKSAGASGRARSGADDEFHTPFITPSGDDGEGGAKPKGRRCKSASKGKDGGAKGKKKKGAKGVAEAKKKSESGAEDQEDGPGPVPGVSLRQKRLVQESWAKVTDASTAGKLFYKKLFSIAPAVKPLFAQVPDMAVQGVKTINAVGLAVNGLDAIHDVEPVLRQLAERHVHYGVEEQHYPVVGRALIATLSEALGGEFTPETSKAWEAVYGFLTTVFVDTHRKAAAQLDKECAPGVSVAQRRLVQDSWALVTDAETAGALFYKKLFAMAPGVSGHGLKPLFSKVDMKAQGVKTINMVGQAVKGLDKVGDLVPVLHDLAKRHVGYGAMEEHYPPVGEALIATLKDALGAAFTPAHGKAWQAVYGLMSTVMLDAHAKAVAAAAPSAGGTPSAAPITAGGDPLEQKKLVQESWGFVTDAGAAGALFYKILFDKAPGVKPLFAKVQDMELQGVKTIKMVGKAVDGLDDLPSVVPVLQQLAERHVDYGAQPEHYPVVGVCLIETLATALGEKFSKDHRAAWEAIYKVVQDTMLAAHAKKVGTGTGITAQSKKLVVESWAKVTDAAAAGELFYKKLFDSAPGVKPLFSKVADMRAQGVKTIKMVGAAVGGLDDLPSVVPVLQQLAERHVDYGAQPEHYPVVGACLIETLATALGEEFTKDHRAAWQEVYKVIQDTMLAAHAKKAGESSGVSASSKKLVVESWAKVTDAAAAGELFYKNLFASAPGVKPLFSKVADMRAQGVKTIKMVGAAVGGLDDVPSLVPVLQGLAKRHVHYGAEEAHYPVVGTALIDTLAEALPRNSFTAEHKAAWGEVYTLISSVMVAAHKEEKSGGIPAASKKLVVESWAKVTDLAAAGELFYAKLFARAPGVKPLFSKVADMRAQGVKTLKVVGAAVGALDDLASVTPVLQALARRHIAYGVEEAHYAVVGAVLVDTLAEALGGSFGDAHRAAWGEVYTLLSGVLVDTHRREAAAPPPPGVSVAHRQLAQSSWAKVSDPQAAGDLFYSTLFRMAPGVKPLFRGDIKEQGVKTIKMVAAAVDGLSDWASVEPALRGLAERHVAYGAELAHYAVVGRALIDTLAAAIGADFTKQHREAWGQVYSYWSGVIAPVHERVAAQRKSQEQLQQKQQQEQQRQKEQLERAKKEAEAATLKGGVTMDDVRKHNKRDDVWIVVKVRPTHQPRYYDVTNWLRRHPGGASVILKYAGKDCTDEFYRVHSSYAIGQLKDWYKGDVQM